MIYEYSVQYIGTIINVYWPKGGPNLIFYYKLKIFLGGTKFDTPRWMLKILKFSRTACMGRTLILQSSTLK